MKLPLLRSLLASALACALPCSAAVGANPAPVVPAPALQAATAGSFRLGPKVRLVVATPALREVARGLQAALREQAGIELSIAEGAAAPDGGEIRLVPAAGAEVGTSLEAYELEIAANGVTIQGASPAGVYYGGQTLVQIVEGQARSATGEFELPGLRIQDQPRFDWRGVLLDESRHFFGKQTVKDLLDVMAYLKLNRFHWHLTDEPGWRIEIKKYPKLTTVGGRGNHTDHQAPAAFYTQADIREIVAYAQERQIMIVPEIDMPGHASAACRAYPELSGGGSPPWDGFTFNPAREETYRFLTDVLTEVAELFPGRYIHLGGDEVSFGNQSWNTDPEILAFREAHGLKDALELERYFVRRMAGVIAGLGKVAMGWDEIGDAGVPPAQSTVIWWRHDKPQVLQQLLAKNYPVVLSPRIPCYFDFVQDASHADGRRWEGVFNPLDGVYGFPEAVLRERVAPGQRNNVVGLEACLWTEVIHNRERLWFMALPRLAAFAEAAWTPASRKDQADFLTRLAAFQRELDRRHLTYFDPLDPARTPEPAGPRER